MTILLSNNIEDLRTQIFINAKERLNKITLCTTGQIITYSGHRCVPWLKHKNICRLCFLFVLFIRILSHGADTFGFNNAFVKLLPVELFMMRKDEQLCLRLFTAFLRRYSSEVDIRCNQVR